MPKTITKTVYEFHELDDHAKTRVKEWLNECSGPEDYDYVVEDFKVVARLLGFMVRVTGGGKQLRDSVYWTSHPWLAGFCADWFFPDKSVTEALRQHLGDDDPLHRDAATFEAALARFRLAHNAAIEAGNITARVEGTEHGYKNIEYYDAANFTSEGGREFTPEEYEAMVSDYDELYGAVEQIAKDLGYWLAKNLEAEEESHWEDDYVKDTCDANEYVFDENGVPA